MNNAGEALQIPTPIAVLRRYLPHCRRILIVVGAGLSASSGISTWRGTAALPPGIAKIEELSSPYKFKEDPVVVWRYSGQRMLEMLKARPNAGHLALAEFVRRHGGCYTVNQNTDGLLEVAGHPRQQMCTIHGSMRTIRCTSCTYNTTLTTPKDLPFLSFPLGDYTIPILVQQLPHCPVCTSLLRPAVVWFTELLANGAPDVVDEWMADGPIDLVMAIGTSLRVYPAAEFVGLARDEGAPLVIVNASADEGPEDGLEAGDVVLVGDAAVVLPDLLGEPTAVVSGAGV